MKKSLCIWLILALAAVVSLPFAFARVDSQREKVVITEEVLSGDPKAAEGVTLQLLTRWDNHALWDTRYKVGSGETESDFDFVEDGVTWPETDSEYLQLNVSTQFGTGVVVGSLEQPEVHFDDLWLPKILEDVASRTKIGETHTETVRMADYYKYYPIELDAMCEAIDMSFYSNRGTEYWADFFHVQVHPEELLEVSITKDGEKRVISVDCNNVEDGRSLGFDTAYAFGENGCFFTYACTDWKTGERVAMGENTGIFYAPYVTENRRLTFEDTLVEKVCDIPEDIVPAQMLWDEEKGELYLAAKAENAYRLYIYNVKESNLTLQQEVTVLEVEELPYWREMTLEEGGIFMKWSDGCFAFVAESEGEYVLWCCNVFVPDTEWLEEVIYEDWTPVEVILRYEKEQVFVYDHALAFDGERLVLASYENSDSVNVTLAVYNREGQLYCGRYHHSGEADRCLGGMDENDWIYAQGLKRWGSHMEKLDFKALNVTME